MYFIFLISKIVYYLVAINLKKKIATKKFLIAI